MKEPSYLFGTMHLKEITLADMPPSVTKAIESTDYFAMEIDPSATGGLESIGSVLNLLQAPDNFSLKASMKEEEYKRVKEFFMERLGLDIILFDKVKPIMLYTMSSLTEEMAKEGDVFDEQLSNYAIQKGKKVIGLETVEQQLTALDALSIDKQVALLIESITKVEKDNRLVGKMVKWYGRYRLKKLYCKIKKGIKDKVFRDALLTQRNIGMTEKLEELLQKNSVFSAVGAGHLPGKDGLIHLLREKGYIVEAVKLTRQ